MDRNPRDTTPESGAKGTLSSWRSGTENGMASGAAAPPGDRTPQPGATSTLSTWRSGTENGTAPGAAAPRMGRQVESLGVVYGVGVQRGVVS